MTRATSELGVSEAQLLAVTRAVNQSFVISGASAQEAEGATRQLAQALASGAFRGGGCHARIAWTSVLCNTSWIFAPTG